MTKLSEGVGPPAEPQGGETQQAVDSLKDTVANIHGRIGRLEQKLSPVTPISDKEATEKRSVGDAETPLGMVLNEVLASALAATDRLDELYNSIDI